ncbi:MAG: hypothetical protein U1E53_02875 [Dongiaceae bacterium]
MADGKAAPPPGARAAVGAALRDLAGRSPGKGLLGGAAGPTEITDDALPIYNLTLADILAPGDPLQRARLAGWRYLLRQGAGMAAADVSAGAAGAPATFGRLVRGPLIDNLVAAVRAAERDGDAGCEMRALEAPAVHRAALWLHGVTDRFLEIAPGADPARPVAAEAFVRSLRVAAERRAAQEAPRGPGSPAAGD